MKFIIRELIDYLERLVIGMVLLLLVLISVAGFPYGGYGQVTATLAIVTLCLIVYIESGRRRATHEHPEFKTILWREFKLFYFLLQRNVSQIVDLSPLDSISPTTRQTVSRSIAVIIITLAVLSISITFYTSAKVALGRNQARVTCNPEIPGTLFNRKVVIKVVRVLDGEGPFPRVAAIISSEGYPDVEIDNQGVGYETIYNGPNPFQIRIIEIHDDSTVVFFVKRLQYQTNQR